jgi:putative selenate reductase
VNRLGYIEADPVTFETSVPGVYAGGDVVNDGPSSIVEAAADGKAIARSILRRHESGAGPPNVDAFDTVELLRRRSRREWRIPVPHSPLEDRKNFKEVVKGYNAQQARAEAARCLDCHSYCSICVGVCPNLALQTFQLEPIELQLPALGLENGEIRPGPSSTFRIRQGFQIAVLADFCNECGNCTTFCPTAGEPYRDKPRVYLDRKEFEAQGDNAFIVLRQEDQWTMEARWAAATHRVELNTLLNYIGPSFRALIDPDTFELLHIERTGSAGDGAILSLEPCATMFVLLNGFKLSLPYFPAAWPAEAGATGKIAHPGYEN